MSKRKVEENTDKISCKKMKNLNLSTSNFLKNKVYPGDKSLLLIGYVDQILKVQTFTNKEKNSKFSVLKFILNNNDGVQVECNLYDDNISSFSHKLKIYEKILINNASVNCAKIYTKGNVPYYVTIQSWSTVENLGKFEFLDDKKNINVSFNDIPNSKGYIRIEAYLISSFLSRKKNDHSELFGAVTDKVNKLDVILYLKDDEKQDFTLGSKLEIIGDLQESGISFVLKVIDLKNINILDAEKLTLQEIYAEYEIFKNNH